ncbi:MAG: M14 family zinc carboxypeptidase, partial [Planctomycetota bacterium]
MRALWLAGFVLGALAPRNLAQDEPPPPVPVEEGGGEQQEEEKKEQQEQEKPPVEDQPAPAVLAPVPADDAPAALAHPSVVWPLSAEALAEHLRLIASAHPECARLETLGTSAGGRPILALRLGVSGPAPVPVLFLAEHRGSASAAPEALVEVAWRLAESFAQDETVRALLTSSAVVLAPALDPDRRAAGEPPAVRFELNFPSGWQPESVRPGAGRVSLSKPEALAVARDLAELRSASVVLGFTERLPRGSAYAGAQ